MKKYKTGYFDIDHPVLNFALNIISWIGIILVGIIVMLIFFTLIILTQNNCYKGSKVFEYIDLDGNIGTAYNCQYTDKNRQYRSGGMGQPVCFVGNKVIAVKQYEDKTQYESCRKIIFGGSNNAKN